MIPHTHNLTTPTHRYTTHRSTHRAGHQTLLAGHPLVLLPAGFARTVAQHLFLLALLALGPRRRVDIARWRRSVGWLRANGLAHGGRAGRRRARRQRGGDQLEKDVEEEEADVQGQPVHAGAPRPHSLPLHLLERTSNCSDIRTLWVVFARAWFRGFSNPVTYARTYMRA